VLVPFAVNVLLGDVYVVLLKVMLCCCLQGFKYLYLTPEDFTKVSAMNSVQAILIDDEGEPRYKITDIIGMY
jgi:hypothetical protein